MTLEIITSPNLAPMRHGFFTRRGGASSGIFSGLNCGHGSSDQREIVEIKKSGLNGASVEASMRIIAGTARSMGIKVVED